MKGASLWGSLIKRNILERRRGDDSLAFQLRYRIRAPGGIGKWEWQTETLPRSVTTKKQAELSWRIVCGRLMTPVVWRLGRVPLDVLNSWSLTGCCMWPIKTCVQARWMRMRR
jgi:hypothetical protein